MRTPLIFFLLLLALPSLADKVELQSLPCLADRVELPSGTTARVPTAYEELRNPGKYDSRWIEPKTHSTIGFSEKRGSQAVREFRSSWSVAVESHSHREVFVKGADRAFVDNYDENNRDSSVKLFALSEARTLEVHFLFRGPSLERSRRKTIDSVIDSIDLGDEWSGRQGTRYGVGAGHLRRTFRELDQYYDSRLPTRFRYNSEISMSVRFDKKNLSESIWYRPLSKQSPWLSRKFVNELKDLFRGEGSFRKAKNKNKTIWINKKMRILLVQTNENSRDIASVQAMTFKKCQDKGYARMYKIDGILKKSR